MRLRPLCLLLAALTVAPAAAVSLAPGGPSIALEEPVVVVALIDSGVNVYHEAFRDDSTLGYTHPCTYLPNYPCSIAALNLHLNETDYATAYALDQQRWATFPSGLLRWIPGTKFVGVIRMGSGGVACSPGTPPPVSTVQGIVGDNPTLGWDCPEERRMLDDHGHGTMTATRAGGNVGSLCPSCRILAIEGLGQGGVRYAADRGWVDVQSNSWLSLIPAPVEGMSTGTTQVLGCVLDPDPACLDNPGSVGGTFAYAASRMPTIAASGNGAAYINGVAPTPTYVLSTAAPGVILVGGHDNGRATLWSGAPTHVVADAFGGNAAGHLSLTAFGPDPISCCTSAAAPYAAGGMAALILKARQLLGDLTPGIANGILAQGTPVAGSAILGDGALDLEEAKRVYFHTAQGRPAEGRDDGLVGFLGEPRVPGEGDLLPYGVGGNPFCQGCMSVPLQWEAIPKGGFTAPHLGYGAINEFSLAKAEAVLAGLEPEPDRSVEDAWFLVDDALRAPLFPG